MPDLDDARQPAALEPAFLLLRLAEIDAKGIPDASHGYALARWMREQGFTAPRTGTMYRYLRSMEEEDLLTSDWRPAQTRGPARRVYQLTDTGWIALKEYEQALADLSGLLGRFRKQYRRL